MENEGTHPISRADVRIEKVLKNIRHEVELYHSEYEGKHRHKTPSDNKHSKLFG